MGRLNAVSKTTFCVLALVITPAFADLDTAINRAILKATAHDTTRSDKEKLFKDRCKTIEKYVGFENDVTGQARKYSCDVPGVGIALYAGKDLGKHSPEKVGQYFVDKLAAEGLKAEVFIKPDHEYGSSMGFYIDGESWLQEPARVSESIKKVDFLADEAKLILFTEGRAKEWIYPSKTN